MIKILSVTQLTQEIKKYLETQIGTVTVRGEVLNLKIQSSGHIYFTLKDAEAQISAVLFKGSLKNVARPPKEGDQVVVQGEITVYAPRGNYQILVRTVQYQGVGELLAKLHERKTRLQAQGFFDPARKKKIPLFPKVIGVVTSPTGAVIQDIIQILQRRHAGFQLILFPVKVQGEGAAKEIAGAIDLFNKHQLADVLIVGRGGGSLEDLWAFNEEEVVLSIFRSNIPIISAVGHETDFSLSDFVADLRAPTPSAAAEMVIVEKEQQFKFILQCQKRIEHHATTLLSRLRKQMHSVLKNPYMTSPAFLLSKRIQQLDEAKMRLSFQTNALLKQKKTALLSLEKQKKLLEPSYQIQAWKEKFKSIQKNIDLTQNQILQLKEKQLDLPLKQQKLFLSFKQLIHKKRENLLKISSHLQSINPKNLLTKGYCILFSENQNSVILSAKELTVSERLKLLLKDGQITINVEDIQHGPT